MQPSRNLPEFPGSSDAEPMFRWGADDVPPQVTAAEWLAQKGQPLNMRCGGRGLCRGCEIQVEGEPRKACQCKARELAGADIRIPRASRQDRSITGVSAFDIDTHLLRERCRAPRRGLALDIGTTTLAAALWSGPEPRCLGTLSQANPQIGLGDNVVSRIQYSVSAEGGDRRLHRVLVEEGIAPLVKQLCGDDAPDAVVIAGNPAMLHSVAGETLAGLASFPFRPVFLERREVDPALLGFPAGTTVLLLPSLGPFVGADISAGAVACGMMEEETPSLLIDFGTNGEILLRSSAGIFATATAAGPAFEGGRLTCGARAGEGVVSGFRAGLDGTGMVAVGGAEGKLGAVHGISGAAYVDFLALGRRSGLLGENGRFQAGAGSSVEPVPGVRVTEMDVAELLQAKAAVQAGWTTLLEVAGVEMSELRRVWIAGGFGYHLNPEHAMAVGLIPRIDPAKIRLVGNSSLGGASLALIDPDVLEKMEQLRAQTTLVELNAIASFEDHYIDALGL
jgi:uncharacterized 2Fe-2S/4Fe-4S cluster protein (DUF4445 family)